MLPFTRPTIGEEELHATRAVLESGWIASGPKALALEKALQEYIGGDVIVRVFNSGTSALEAALLAHDIGPGDEVIVPAISFVASANVIVRVGATPVFAEVGLQSRNIDIASLRKALTPRTRAILPVHFAGLSVDLDAIYDFAEQHRLHVIEDAAHAIGTRHQGRQIGSRGNAVCFSFHPNKNMTTIEGGALACRDPQYIKRIERLRFHGIERDAHGVMDVPEWGGKMNLADVNAAVGLAQLPKLDGFNRRRTELAQRYFGKLPRDAKLILPADGDGHSWHMFCVCIDHVALGTTRAAIMALFQKHGVALGLHYPAMHLFSLYRGYGYSPGDFPNAERIGEQTVTLPLFPSMSDADVDRVSDLVHQLLTGKLQ